jgi:hypothetical protein
MNANARARAVYGALVTVLFAAQAAFTFAGLDRMWYEELADFVRSPFWFSHRLVYDGASANVAWYGLLVLTYKVFGFSPYASKYLRLALQVPCLVCSAWLLVRWLGARRAWLPLVAIGLSPTALYFNSVCYGIDLQLFPVIVWLIVRAGDQRGLTPFLQFAIGGLAMFACLSYPAFLMYVPVLLAFYVWTRRSRSFGESVTSLAVVAAGFLTPLVAAYAYLQNRSAFLSDPSVGGAGVFRGGGNAMALNVVGMARAIAVVFQDLFVRGSSYYFALPHVEFSGLIGVAAAWAILVAALVVAWNWKPSRVPLVLAAALCLVAVVVPSLSQYLPGLRRSTGFIAATYVVLACVWGAPVPSGLRATAVWAGRIACVLLVAHHLIVFAPNRRYLQAETSKVHDPWFNRFGSPAESIQIWVNDWVQKGRPLTCESSMPCRYAEIYAALAGYMQWNGLDARPVLATNPATGQVTPLDIPLLRSGRFPP